MAGPDRTASDRLALLAAIADAPHAFDFFLALRRLECLAPERPRLGESALAQEDPVRLGQTPSLAFAPRTIHGLAENEAGAPPRMEVLFFGLFGPNGPLPLHLTEYALERLQHHHDPTFSRFADIFHHRMLSLFYRAWANAEPTVQLDRPESDFFARYVGSLIGIGSPALQDRDTVPDHGKLYYAGRFAAGPRHPEGLEAMLADFFGLPVQIEEFVGQWCEIPPQCRCIMRERTGTMYPWSVTALGRSTTIGSAVWDRRQRFRIVLGPLSLDDYLRFMPGGRSLRLLVDLVRNYLNDELTWELQLVLRKEEAPALRIGEAGMLGMTGWIEPESLESDADDYRWDAQLDGAC